ncbi:acetyl-CoA synthetase-like protein [Aspergillus californicus]
MADTAFPLLSDGVRSGSRSHLQWECLKVGDLQRCCMQRNTTPEVLIQAVWAVCLHQFLGTDGIHFGVLASSKGDCRAHLVQTCFTSETSFDDVLQSTGVHDHPEADCLGSGTHEVIVDFLPSVTHLVVQLNYVTSRLSDGQAKHVAALFEHICDWALSGSSVPLSNVDWCSEATVRQLAQWNDPLPHQDEKCLDEIILQQCRQQPQSPAVCAWDGGLSYNELEALSDRLSLHLRDLGVGPEVFVPIYMEKSKWAAVAMLAVMRAGGAFVLLDPAYPSERLKQMCVQVSTRVLISLAKYRSMAQWLAHAAVVLDEDNEKNWPEALQSPSRCSPRNALYAVFTSGSTGTPKAVVIEHAAFASSATAHARPMGLGPSARVFQFSSYAFDVSVSDHLTTLIAGGCICIPSEEDRSDIASAMNRMQVNWAHLTPSVLRLLSPTEVPTLRTLVLIGEPMSKSDVSTWGGTVHLICAYGPAESSVVSTVQSQVSWSDARNIGFGAGVRCWVVDQQDYTRLAPIGVVGELLLEGASLARGYVNDAEKTAAAFVHAPTWLDRFGVAQSRRLYRTGDLVRYNSNGSLVYIGRRDSQVKIRGQRVELGEVEHHLRRCFPEPCAVVVEAIRAERNSNQTLVALISTQGRDHGFGEDSIRAPPTESFGRIMDQIKRDLQRCLPAYMIPSRFLEITRIPLTPSGKTDRRRIRDTTAEFLQAERLDNDRPPSPIMAPFTHAGRQLRNSWAQALGFPAEKISTEDEFFRLGGDSIGAMRIVSLLRKEGLALCVADIFNHPRLCDLALHVRPAEAGPAVVAFSLLPATEDPRNLAVAQCGLTLAEVEDIYPCTALQEGLIALSQRSPGVYTSKFVYDLPDAVDIRRFKTAWANTIEANVILRTRIVQTLSGRLFQVVVKRPIEWESDPKEAIAMRLGTPLTRFSLDCRTFCLTIHHAVYDGWSLPLILDQVWSAYNENPLFARPFSPFIRYLQTRDLEQARQFWLSYLEGLSAESFPRLPTTSYTPNPSLRVQKDIPLGDRPTAGFTLSSALRAAWAILIAQHTDSDDVVFGCTVTGRNLPVDRIEGMTGPTVATVPVRVQFSGGITVQSLLHTVHKQFGAMMPFEQTGLQNIRQLGVDSAKACQFQNLLVIQPRVEAVAPPLFRGEIATESDYNSYGLTMICHPQDGVVHCEARFDPGMITSDRVQNLLHSLAFILPELLMRTGARIDDLDLISPEDKHRLGQWNANVPERKDTCVHHLIQEQCTMRKEAPAICAWNGDVSYADLDILSMRVAAQLSFQGVKPGDFVPIYSEKSKWTTIAMIGILKAGAAFVLLDPSHPLGRLRKIADDVEAKVIVSSVENAARSNDLVSTVLVLDDDERFLTHTSARWTAPATYSSSPAYIAFTSGSTGKPKGVIVEHGSFCASALAHGRAMSMDSTSRVLQFASYAFDVSISDNLTTLLHGGCICVPSDVQRKNSLAQAATQFGANWANLTPTTSRILHPADVPTLKKLVLSGESMSRDDIATWSRSTHLMSSYGPAECAVKCIIHSHITSEEDPFNLGVPTGCVCWIVNKHDYRKLNPIGCVGEVLVEGPIVGRGYHKDPERTAAQFVQPPAWLKRLRAHSYSRLYRTGDLAQLSPDGSLRYVGRQDTQAKVRGQRIELEEVEHHIRRSVPDAQYIVAEVFSVGTPAQQSVLAAFISYEDSMASGHSTEHPPDAVELFAAPTEKHRKLVMQIEQNLSDSLPPYMIPNMFLPVKYLPMTKSGKADRRHLRAMAGSLSREEIALYATGATKRGPTSSAEKQLRSAFSSILNLAAESIGIDDSFFHLGGDSITAMQLSARCRADSVQLDLRDIFRHKSIARLAPCCSPLYAPLEEVQEEVGRTFPLTPIQQLFFEAAPEGYNHYNQSFFLRLTRLVSVENLKHAVEQIINHHSMLRVRFASDSAGRWNQSLTDDVQSSYDFESLELANRTEFGHSAATAQRCVDPVNGPMLVVRLVRITGADDLAQYLYLVVHHLVIDLVSWRIIIHDLEGLLNGATSLMTKAMPFQVWSRLQEAHSRRNLSPEKALQVSIKPTRDDYWGMATGTNRHGDVVEQSFSLGVASTAALLGSCNRPFRTQPVEVLHAALALSFMMTFPDRVEPVIFSEGHGREPWDQSLDVSETVGWFTTMWPLQVRCDSPKLVTILARIKDGRRQTPANGWAYFASRYLNPDGQQRFRNHFPIEIMFNYEGMYQQLERADGLFGHPTWRPEGVSDVGGLMDRFALIVVSARVVHSSLQFSWAYNRHMRQAELMSKWMQRCQNVLDEAVQTLPGMDLTCTLSDFPLLALTYPQLDMVVKETLPKLGITSDRIQDAYPCSPMQQGILINQVRDPQLYCLSTTWEIFPSEAEDGICLPALEAAWHHVVNRHDMFRTVFVEGTERGSASFNQFVLTKVTPCIQLLDSTMGDLREMLSLPVHSPLLEGKPAHRLTIQKQDSGRVTMALTISHALIDGSSTYVLLRELALTYSGRPPLHSSPPYSDYVKHLSNRPMLSSQAYWERLLRGIRPCIFPSIRCPSRTDSKTKKFVCVPIELGSAPRIQDFCCKTGVTVSNLLHVAWGLVLRIYTGQDQVCFGYLVSGRDIALPNVRDAVGPYINMLVSRLEFAPQTSLLHLLQKNQNDFLESLPHQHLTPGDISVACGISDSQLFNTLVSVQHPAPFTHMDGSSIHFRSISRHEPTEASLFLFPCALLLLLFYDIGLHVYVEGGALNATFRIWDNVLSGEDALRVGATLDKMITRIMDRSDMEAFEVQQWGSDDQLKQVPGSMALPQATVTVNQLIATRCYRQPAAPAVCAWDGSFTYSELDKLSSELAYHLNSQAVIPESFIPVCFSKSRWVAVSILGIIKAGAAFILLDPSYPLPRLQGMCRQVGARWVISSYEHMEISRSLAPTIIVLNDNGMDWRGNAQVILPSVSITQALYAVFTSGSTGDPKAVVVEQGALAASAQEHVCALGLSPSSRAFQFSSYTFDVSISDHLFTLIAGGCICIPSEQERLGDVFGAIGRLEINWAHLTPSVLKLLARPENVPGLQTLASIGEPLSQDDVDTWSGKLRLINAYGPAECSVVTTVQPTVSAASHPQNIGTSTAARCWLTYPNNLDRLVPIGVVGEMLVEGPIVARGYLNDKRKTVASFINAPGWLRGSQCFAGHSHLYRTGDLARRNMDGSLTYVGRKDTQVKIRGQRVELGEVEIHIQRHFPQVKMVVAEVIQGPGSQSSPILACFVVLHQPKAVPIDEDLFESITPSFMADVTLVESRLVDCLPLHMRPAFYVPLRHIPITKSGKTDRIALRRAASQHYKKIVQGYEQQETDQARIANETESILAQIMARVLGSNSAAIHRHSNFFRLGGDSIRAMELGSLARQAGLRLSVLDIFRNPTIAQLARVAHPPADGNHPRLNLSL